MTILTRTLIAATLAFCALAQAQQATTPPLIGTWAVDVSRLPMLAPNLLVMHLARDGAPVSSRTYVVSDSGQTMIETVAYVGADGMPLVKTNYFSRVR